MVNSIEYNKKNIPKISVIIPCYNSGKTIRNALESLEFQSYKDFEVIVVNDGSRDNTLEVIEDYKRQSPLSIQVILQENGGVSVARNTGLLNAQGEFITFLDADDRYYPNFLEMLYDAITKNNVDFAFCKYIFSDLKSRYNVLDTVSENNTISKIEILKVYIHKRTEKVNFVCGIYRSEILKKYNLSFPKGVRYGEDSKFYCEYIFHCNQGGIYIRKPLYEYVIRNDSATHNINYNMVQNIEIYKEIVKYWSSNDTFVTENLGCYMINRAIWGVAKKLALLSSKENYEKFCREYEVVDAMKYMSKYGDERSIRISARIYCMNSKLFQVVVRAYARLVKRMI